MCFTITGRGLTVAMLWAVGIALALLDAFYPPPLAALSIGFMVGAATLSVRGSIDNYAANWETAYSAGREVTRLRERQ